MTCINLKANITLYDLSIQHYFFLYCNAYKNCDEILTFLCLKKVK